MSKLIVKNISKKFHKKTALQQISCEFSNGITALLGQNGAGKSTLMNIMGTLISPDSGTVEYNGQDIVKLRSEYLGRIAVQFQNQPMYKNYTAREYLFFCGALKGMTKKETAEQGERLLHYFGLKDCEKKRIGSFSGGMKQRLALCGTFLGNPEIIFLDEPSAGLDIYEREELKNLLCDLKENCIIIISTHIVSDVENISDQIILLNHGKIYASGSQKELISDIQGKIWQLPDVSIPKTELRIYHSNGKAFCISDAKPCAEAIQKEADLTDVYFSSLIFGENSR